MYCTHTRAREEPEARARLCTTTQTRVCIPSPLLFQPLHTAKVREAPRGDLRGKQERQNKQLAFLSPLEAARDVRKKDTELAFFIAAAFFFFLLSFVARSYAERKKAPFVQ